MTTPINEATVRQLARRNGYALRRARRGSPADLRFTLLGYCDPETGGVLKGSGRVLDGVGLEQVAAYLAARPHQG